MEKESRIVQDVKVVSGQVEEEEELKGQDTHIFVGFETPTKNFFHMPNNWTDITSQIDNLSELKVVEYVVRHTWGYQEYGVFKTISVDEFMRGRRKKDRSRMDLGTGLSEPSVKDGIRRALAHGYITCIIDEKDKGRTKKSYAIKMRPASSDENGVSILPPQDTYPPRYLPRKKVAPRGQESYPRSEKDTLEIHSSSSDGEKPERKEEEEEISAHQQAPSRKQEPPVRIEPPRKELAPPKPEAPKQEQWGPKALVSLVAAFQHRTYAPKQWQKEFEKARELLQQSHEDDSGRMVPFSKEDLLLLLEDCLGKECRGGWYKHGILTVEKLADGIATTTYAKLLKRRLSAEKELALTGPPRGREPKHGEDPWARA